MKKIFFSVLAIAAIAACSKSEVQYTEVGEIAFSPIASNTTKSVAGYNGDEFDGVFPTAIPLYVFANAQDVENGTTWNSPYFKNALFTHYTSKGEEATQTHPTLESVSTTGAYAGNPNPYYWPNVKTLKFAGVSKACNINAESNGAVPVINTEDNATMTITIANYVQDNKLTDEGANDLMWFPIAGPYGKGDGEIPAQMKHACSWITVKVKTDGKFTDVKLHDLTITGLCNKGTATCGSTASWASLTGSVTEQLYYNADGKDVTTDAEVFETTSNNMIVIPQTPTKINVTYSYTPQTGLTCKETFTGLDLKISDTNNMWESGVHYIYTLTITATEILIDPVVVKWDEFEAGAEVK